MQWPYAWPVMEQVRRRVDFQRGNGVTCFIAHVPGAASVKLVSADGSSVTSLPVSDDFTAGYFDTRPGDRFAQIVGYDARGREAGHFQDPLIAPWHRQTLRAGGNGLDPSPQRGRRPGKCATSREKYHVVRRL